ncbi:MAG: arsenate reductase [Candidatus Endobugula sp.]|jgi:arsenate reductase
MITIYHNPRCSKSRQTLALIEEKGLQPHIVLYLNTPLVKANIRSLLVKLDMTARDIIRKGEDAYKENNLRDARLSDDELIQAIIDHPKLLERPIAVKGGKAVIGRPPENVLALL